MAVLLTITDWSVHFENNRTRELKVMSWIPVPVKLGGDGYTEILDHPNGAAHFGAWIAILQVAAGCDERGTLLRGNRGGVRSPHDAQSISRMTRIPVSIIEEAIPRLVAAGWITAEEVRPNGSGAASSCGNPADACGNPAPSCEITAPRASRATPQDIGVQRSTGECTHPPPSPGAFAREEHTTNQKSSPKTGALPPEPPVAHAPGKPNGDVQDANSSRDVRTAAGDRDRRQAIPPPSASGNGRGGAPLPGEDELETIAEELWRNHPSGVRGGSIAPVQRALLDLLKLGRIRPGPAPPEPAGFSVSFAELLERHALWSAAWEAGVCKPMNLAKTWLGKCEFLDMPPQNKASPRNGNGVVSSAEWNPGSDPGEVEKLKRGIFG